MQTFDGTTLPLVQPDGAGGHAQVVYLVNPSGGGGSGAGSALVSTPWKASAAGTGYAIGDFIDQVDEWNITVTPAVWTATTWRNITQGTTLATAPNIANLIPVSSTASTVTANMGTTGGLALDGTDITAAAMPAGGTGIRGWLSGIFQALSNVLTVVFKNPASFLSQQGVLTAAGTSQNLANYALTNGIVITAAPSNKGVLYIGASNAVGNATNGTNAGYALAAGQSISLAVTNQNAVWINGTVTNDIYSVIGN